MERQLPTNWSKWWARAVKLLVVVVVVWAVRRTLWEGLTRLDEHAWRLAPAWLFAAAALYLAGLFPAALFWRHLLGVLGQDAGLGQTLRAYYVGHLGKYVPGKVMVVVLRTGLIQGNGVGRALAAASVFVETLLMMSVGAVWAAVILAGWFREQRLLYLVAAGCAVIAGLPILPPVFRRLVWLTGVGRFDPALADRLGGLRLGTMLLGAVAASVGWVLMGLSLWATLRAMGVADLDLVVHWPRYVASVALATVAGFVSFVPGGAVVREAVLVGLMAPHFGDAVSVGSAILLRLIWLVAEVVVSGILYVSVRRSP